MQSVLDYSSPATSNNNRFAWLGWAIYLGMSWTWCIGMFLPVLLVRDYGPWAWVVFAVPNVIGAACVGWALSTHRSSEIAATHADAVVVFSYVTAAFQLFFTFWAIQGMRVLPYLSLILVIPLAVLSAACRGLPRLTLFALASFTLIVSIFVFIGAMDQSRSGSVLKLPEFIVHDLPARAADLVPLAAVCCMGFLLCPYLDATFLLARSETDTRQSRLAFSVGFGVFFLLMIFATLAYSEPLARWLPTLYAKAAAFFFLALHWIVHLAFTSGQHWAVVDRHSRRVDWRSTSVRGVITLTIAAGAWLITARLPNVGFHRGELVYRIFIAFYGLVFPAYVWLCMIPGRGRVAPSRRQLVVLAVSVLIAAPMFWMGFIERKMFWLLPGLAIVLLSRLLIPRRDYAQGTAL